MAQQVSRAQLMNKLKNKAKGAWSRAKNAEAKARGQGGLPGGIKDGVAILKKYKFDATSKGDPMFTLVGIVVEPEEYKGMQAFHSYFINDDPPSFRQPKTAEDKLNELSSDLQLLGGEPPDDIDGIPDLMEELCSQGIHYLYNTFQSEESKKKGGMAKAYIQGLAEGFENDPSATEGEGDQESQDSGDSNGESEGEGEGEAQEGEGDEGAEYVPQKGDPYNWKHPKLKKIIPVIIQDADEEKRTVTLKTKQKIEGKVQTFTKVSFDKLIGEAS